MKKIIIAVALLLTSLFVMPSLAPAPVYAASGAACECKDKNGNVTGQGHMTEGAILSYCDCGNGEGIKSFLSLVVEILTVSIGALAAVGLGFSGVQYLTAGGNEEQTRKAKRRIFEIVIGIAAYVLIYALLYFLVPDFKPFS